MADKGPYFLIRSKPFLVCGPDKWLNRQELLRNEHCIYSFPTAKDAQNAQMLLPKMMRMGTVVSNASSLYASNGLEYIKDKGFIDAASQEIGPMHEMSFNRAALAEFVVGGNGPVKNTDSEKVVPVPEGEPPKNSLIHAANTALDPIENGRDTTLYNNSVTMFQSLLETLETAVSFRDNAPTTVSEQLSIADREILDEMHFLEFNQLNAANGFKVYQRLHDLRLKRRAAKDSAIIATFMTDLLAGIDREKLSKYQARLQGLRSRQYLLREPELFEHDSENGRLL